MTKQDAIDFYGGITELATALNVTISAISQWGDYPPGGRQMQLENITNKKLLAEPDCMVSKRTADKAGA